MKTRAVYFTGLRQVEVRETEVGDPAPHEVQVQCLANGICMWEVSLFTGVEKRDPPYVAGHEGLGRVVKAGREVTTLREGDYVACSRWQEYDNLPAVGLARYSRTPADPAVMVAEPSACVAGALSSYEITAGDRVLLLGAGYMGLLNVQGLAHCPISELVVVDVKPHNLAVAKACGATEVIQSGTPAGDARLAELKARPFDLVVECAGVESVLRLAGNYCRRGGRLSIFSWHHGMRALDFGEWHIKGLKVVNSSPGISADRSINMMDRAVRCLECGIFDQRPLITHRHDLDHAQEAMEINATRGPGFIKGVLTF